MNKPVIGIVAKHYKDDNIRTDGLIRDEMKNAILSNGGVAIGILNPSEEILYCDDTWTDNLKQEEKENLIETLKLCDGIILQGGRTNEVYENFIAKYCFQKDIPILGICLGQTSLVRGLGGTIKDVQNKDKHLNYNDFYVHNITIKEDSLFYKIIKRKEIKVNSRHKTVIATCPNLEVVAYDEDGNIEVVENKEKRFCLGVRFHPESLYKIDDLMNNIFEYFINACKK